MTDRKNFKLKLGEAGLKDLHFTDAALRAWGNYGSCPESQRKWDGEQGLEPRGLAATLRPAPLEDTAQALHLPGSRGEGRYPGKCIQKAQEQEGDMRAGPRCPDWMQSRRLHKWDQAFISPLGLGLALPSSSLPTALPAFGTLKCN